MKPIEDINTVGWPAELMQNHVFECHDAIRELRPVAAASPELLEALVALLSQLEQGMECHGIAVNSPTTKNAISRAREAIAKACPGHPLATA